MFHRVKSENPSEDNQVSEEAINEVEQTDAQEENSETAEASDQTEDTTETTTQTEEKDTEEMTETPEAETATEEETAAASTMKPASYGRPLQPAARTSGYPGSYPGAASYAAQNTTADQDSGAERTLTIGAGITMSGEIEACDNLVIEGTVEAALKGARNLDITETGTFYGSVEIEEANIAGRFEGELTVTGRLTLRAGGVITGSVAYGELEIEAGSLIDGRLTPIAVAQQSQQAPTQGKASSQAKAKVSRSETKAPANTDGELFAAKA